VSKYDFANQPQGRHSMSPTQRELVCNREPAWEVIKEWSQAVGLVLAVVPFSLFALCIMLYWKLTTPRSK